MSENAVLMGGDFDGCGVCGVGRFLFPEAQVLESEILGQYPHGCVPGVEKGDDPIFLPAAFEGEEAEPLLKGQCVIVSAPQGGVRVPALDPIAIVLHLSRVHGHRVGWALVAGGQSLLWRVVEIGPDHGFAAIGIIGSPHPNFVSVIQVRGSGREELQGDHLPPSGFLGCVGGPRIVAPVFLE